MTSKAQVLTIKKDFQRDLIHKRNVNGIGLGFKVAGQQQTGKLCLVVLVAKKMKIEHLDSSDLVPGEIQGIKTDVIEIGNIIAHDRTERIRPVQPGFSIGHLKSTAGTFGAVVRDTKTGEKLILSNNHVIANSNQAEIGDHIIQPGPSDGGENNSRGQIATLERYVRIKMIGESDDTGPTCPIAKGIANSLSFMAKLFGSKHRIEATRVVNAPTEGANRIDAAVAKPLASNLITDEIMDIGRITKIRSPELGMTVMKSGRSTGTTEGSIMTLNAYIKVGYGDSRYAEFEDQILTSEMSKPGDSGSLLVSKESNEAIGLLFAGSGKVSVVSPILFVMDALNIDFNI